MTTVKSGQTWSGLIVCKDSTGALATPSVGPAGVLYVDGTANGASVTISGSNPYKWTCVLPTLTAGQCVSMYVTATIATIATASVVAEDVADTVRLSDVPAVNVTYWAGEALHALIDGVTVEQLLSVLKAKLLNRAEGGGTTQHRYYAADGVTTAVDETVDVYGNRLAVTIYGVAP